MLNNTYACFEKLILLEPKMECKYVHFLDIFTNCSQCRTAMLFVLPALLGGSETRCAFTNATWFTNLSNYPEISLQWNLSIATT